MTWIVYENGRRWVESPPRKHRRTSHVPTGRFKDVKVGDWLVKTWPVHYVDGIRRVQRFYLVSHAWFDPVEGERNPMQGEFFAVALLQGIHRDTLEPIFARLEKHTRRGLASQSFHYADHNPVERLRATIEGMTEGKVTRLTKSKRRSWTVPVL